MTDWKWSCGLILSNRCSEQQLPDVFFRPFFLVLFMLCFIVFLIGAFSCFSWCFSCGAHLPTYACNEFKIFHRAYLEAYAVDACKCVWQAIKFMEPRIVWLGAVRHMLVIDHHNRLAGSLD